MTSAPVNRRWIVAPPDAERGPALARALGLSPVAAQILLNRGVNGDAARAFLRPDLSVLADPYLLPDMDRAVERIERAVRDREKVWIFGDYDVDGTSGTALLWHFFRFLGVPVGTYTPHRVAEGYSLGPQAVDAFAREGVKLAITVDCGTSDAVRIAEAKARGTDVIVSDHHDPPAVLPDAACAFINPKRPGSRYPYPTIAGSGVAFKLAWAMAQRLPAARRESSEFRAFMPEAMAFAALGTIADVSPLTGENRTIVAFGLKALEKTRLPGLRALLKFAGLEGQTLNAGHVGFRIGPRLNASGRIDTAQRCIDLLTCDDPVRAETLAGDLERLNRERQGIERGILDQAEKRIAEEIDLSRERVLVLADDRWHAGVIGIVAARLVERHHRPAVLIGLDGESGKGSARSIPGFNLFEAFDSARHAMIACGGHAMAAGCTIARDKVSLLRSLMNARADEVLKPEDYVPRLSLDAEVPLTAVSEGLVRELERLEPFGHGNPAPVLAVRGARVAGEPRTMGKKGEHLQFHVSHGGHSLRAVGWGMADRERDLRDGRGAIDVAFTPAINEWKGRTSVELIIKDIRFATD